MLSTKWKFAIVDRILTSDVIKQILEYALFVRIPTSDVVKKLKISNFWPDFELFLTSDVFFFKLESSDWILTDFWPVMW